MIIHVAADMLYNAILPNQVSTSVNPELDAAVHSRQFHNSKTAISYCSICSTYVVVLDKFPALDKSHYRAQFNCTR